MDSILNSIKKMLGMPEEYEHFDQDLIMHINSVFMILSQLGVGPDEGFAIQNSSNTWDEYLEDGSNLESVKTYIYLKVKTIFDPPQSGIVTEAINKTISELEWRLTVEASIK